MSFICLLVVLLLPLHTLSAIKWLLSQPCNEVCFFCCCCCCYCLLSIAGISGSDAFRMCFRHHQRWFRWICVCVCVCMAALKVSQRCIYIYIYMVLHTYRLFHLISITLMHTKNIKCYHSFRIFYVKHIVYWMALSIWCLCTWTFSSFHPYSFVRMRNGYTYTHTQRGKGKEWMDGRKKKERKKKKNLE